MSLLHFILLVTPPEGTRTSCTCPSRERSRSFAFRSINKCHWFFLYDIPKFSTLLRELSSHRSLFIKGYREPIRQGFGPGRQQVNESQLLPPPPIPFLSAASCHGDARKSLISYLCSPKLHTTTCRGPKLSAMAKGL